MAAHWPQWLARPGARARPHERHIPSTRPSRCSRWATATGRATPARPTPTWSGPSAASRRRRRCRRCCCIRERLGEPVALTVNYAAALADGAFDVQAAAGAHQPLDPALDVEMLQDGAGRSPPRTAVTALRRETWGASEMPMPRCRRPQRRAAHRPRARRRVARPLRDALRRGRDPADMGRRSDTATASRACGCATSRRGRWTSRRSPRWPTSSSRASGCAARRSCRSAPCRMTVYFHADAAQLAATGTGYLLGAGQGQGFRNGYFDQTGAAVERSRRRCSPPPTRSSTTRSEPWHDAHRSPWSSAPATPPAAPSPGASRARATPPASRAAASTSCSRCWTQIEADGGKAHGFATRRAQGRGSRRAGRADRVDASARSRCWCSTSAPTCPSSILDETARKYFKVWEMACFAGFLNGARGRASAWWRARHAAPSSSPAPRPRCAARANFAAFAGAKHALRALAQSMARELGPARHPRGARGDRRRHRHRVHPRAISPSAMR